MTGATMDGAVAQTRPHAQGLSGTQWLGRSDYIGERYEPFAGLWSGADDLGAYLQGLLASRWINRTRGLGRSSIPLRATTLA